jgi:hypothetical protein
VTISTVAGFLPSTHALRFTNSWPHEPTIRIGLGPLGRIGMGDAADGLCGGMAFTVADLFAAGVSPPIDPNPPAEDSDRYKYVVRRQIDSIAFGRLPLEFYRLMAASPATRARSVAVDEWSQIRADLDAGRPTMLGLVRVGSVNPFDLTRNHQVMAYGYDWTSDLVRLRIYEPNYGPRDDVTIDFTLTAGGVAATDLTQSTGEELFALFHAPYASRDPAPWRP